MITKVFFRINNDIDYIVLAFLFCIPMISFVFNYNNIIPILLLSLLILLVINKKLKITKDFKTIYSKLTNYKFVFMFILCFLIILALNLYIFGFNSHYIKRVLYFIVYGFLPCLICYILFTEKSSIQILKVFKYINFIYGILSVFIYFTNFWVYSTRDRMAISYYFLPLLISIFFELILDTETLKEKTIRLILYAIVFFPYFKFTIELMSRGTILSFFLCIYFTILSMFKMKKKLIILMISFIVIAFLYFYGIYVLEFINKIFSFLDISVGFLNKNIMLLQAGSLGNGRDIIYQNAISGILNHPLLGNGIGSFESLYGTYPHNFILQSWFEGGIFYMMLMSFPVFYSFIRIIISNKIQKEKKYMFIFVFFLTIIRLSLSFEYWIDMFYWIYLFMSITFIQADLKKERVKWFLLS